MTTNSSKDRHASYMREYYRTNEEYRRKHIAKMTEYNRRPEVRARRKARTAVSNAVRDGRLVKPDACSLCGGAGGRIEAHHRDYSCPLEVVWLCSTCHGKEHRG